MYDGMITFVVAFATSFALTVPVLQPALRIGMVDHADTREVHRTPRPLLGGLATYCGTVLAVVFSLRGEARGQILGILVGATLLLVIGTLDDRGWLHHQIKLMVAMPMAALLLIPSGIRTHLASALVSGPVGSALDVSLTLF